MPKRIQRKRTKGYRMPEGAVYVGRPTRWGNPFWLHPPDLSLKLYRNAAQGIWDPSLVNDPDMPDLVVETTYRDHQAFLARMGGHPIDAMRSELTGRDLACWCRPDRGCHADILLELANDC